MENLSVTLPTSSQNPGSYVRSSKGGSHVMSFHIPMSPNQHKQMSLSFFCMKSYVAVATVTLIFLTLKDFTGDRKSKKGQCRCLFLCFSYHCPILLVHSIHLWLIRISRVAGF